MQLVLSTFGSGINKSGDMFEVFSIDNLYFELYLINHFDNIIITF
jgi:hypothetical protein